MTTPPSPKPPFPVEVHCDGDTIAARFSMGRLTFTALWHHATADDGTSRWRTTRVLRERPTDRVGPVPNDDVVANTVAAMTAALDGLEPAPEFEARVADAFAPLDLPVFTQSASTYASRR